ncbi:hypothetical protein POI8812_02910 [Pontivivens insulae]|uniref:GST N-terminal domain-containing protein n=2 Tax=Pontivivens insulae TaxID=1639689 RepID=A0A2R8AE86_9RHOB|nr:glutathione S-transferase [Pontivivens insulae]SPF30571.1 hypothetical protein POI8812_02910 [Pontivivens insulae]
MTWDILIGDRTYSSWSLRGWLLFAGFETPVNVYHGRMYSDELEALKTDFGAGRLVPQMRRGDVRVWDTLAMAETLADENPAMWPSDPAQRALARAMTAEMHSGFGALRNDCTMNLRHAYEGFEPSDAVRKDVARIEELWSTAHAMADGGPWLFGAYSIADVFYAPVATRIATYRLPVGAVAAEYVKTTLSHLPLRQWRARGIAENYVQPGYDLELPRMPWPGPTAPAGRVIEGVDPINKTCPFSGKPVRADSIGFINGAPIGFCNTFCRDKAIADPGAWPELSAMDGFCHAVEDRLAIDD